MVYVWEFEFFDSDGMVDAVPCGSLGGGGTFGSDINDAVESAADFLACMVDDHLMGGVDLPEPDFGHQPQHGGDVYPVTGDSLIDHALLYQAHMGSQRRES